MLNEIRSGGGMERISLDEAKTKLDAELAKPIPGRRQREVAQSVIDDEMALFNAGAARAAAGVNGR